MSTDDIVADPVEEQELQTEESVIMSMDDISLEKEPDGLDVEAILNKDLSEESSSSDEADEDTVVIDPIEVVPENIEALLQPLEGSPAGEDPRYSDEFVLMKVEIDKLSLNDYNAIMTLAREILTNQSKDLRVAGYFMMANSYINGAKGLLEGLILYRQLLERFGDDIFPVKENARNIALQWLNNNKLSAYVKQHQEAVNEELINSIEKHIERLNQDIIATTNDDTLCFYSLNDWVKETKKNVATPPPSPPSSDVSSTESEASSDAGSDAGSAAASSGEVKNDITRSDTPQSDVNRSGDNPLADIDTSSTMSDTELYSFIRKIVKQLMTDKQYARGIAYARAARWGGMSMPPNEGGKTRLTAPRQSGVNQITSLLASGDNEAALSMCEGIFFEMGGHILIDLQMYAHRAAKAMGNNDVANLIAYETSAFLQRFPGIEELRFDDDTPCANGECVSWIDKLGANGKASMPLFNSSDDDKELLESIDQACEVANDKDLTAGLLMMDQYRVQNAKQRFQLQLAMSQLCLDHGRADLAMPMLEELNEQSVEHSLGMWDVTLAMSVAKQLQNALRAVLSGASEQNRAHYEQRLDEVTAQMCRWDLAQAAQFL